MSTSRDGPEVRELRERAWDGFWGERRDAGGLQPGGLTRWGEPYLKAAHVTTVVDLGCGPARDMAYLLEQGYTVTGVDCSAVAIELAEKTISRRAGAARARARLVRSDLVDFLAEVPSGSVDAVHAATTYQGLTEGELRRLIREIHRILVPRGLHLWSVRTDRHGKAARPEEIPPSSPALGLLVPARFFSEEDTEALVQGRFERVEFSEVENRPGLWSFRILDRKGPT
jgi:SAM-dependent methyltransferase